MRITESQLRRIIKQEARALREGRMDTQTEVAVADALSQWRRLSDVTAARQELARAERAAKGITPAQVNAALEEAVATMQGTGMSNEEITDYLYKRVEKMGFSESGAADITRAIYELTGPGSAGY